MTSFVFSYLELILVSTLEPRNQIFFLRACSKVDVEHDCFWSSLWTQDELDEGWSGLREDYLFQKKILFKA
jgi:hypothetical protein